MKTLRLSGILLRAAHKFSGHHGWLKGLEKAGDELDEGTYRASKEKGSGDKSRKGWAAPGGGNSLESVPVFPLGLWFHPLGHLVMSRQVFGCHDRRAACYRHLVGGVQGCY